jgi:6-phospho-beta-glucosidase
MRSYTSGHISLGELRAWKAAGITPTMLPGDEEILAAGAPNFMAVNWYCSTVVDTAAAEGEGGVLNIGAAFRASNPYLDYTEWGWSFDPRALRIALRECYERFHLPLMVCENGWSQREELGADGTVHDAKRIDYIREHVASMSQAIDEGVDLIGYTYWSFVDILSSSDGMGKRYGLVYVDREDFDEKECARHPKDSFWYYQKVTAPVPVAPLKDGPKSYRLMVACGN